jgi:hypothetical protein
MCMSVGIHQDDSKIPLVRAWRRFAACPFRLFTLASLIHTGVLFTLVFGDFLPYSRHTANTVLFVAFYGLLSTPVLGALLYWLPQRFNRQAVSYGWFSFIYLLIVLALGLIQVGLLLGKPWIMSGSTLLMLAWYMALRTFSGFSIWCSNGDRAWLRLTQLGLLLGMVGIASFAVGLGYDKVSLSASLPSMIYVASSSVLVLGVLRLHFIKPVAQPDGARCLAR